jgi:hypothetical protein
MLKGVRVTHFCYEDGILKQAKEEAVSKHP